MEGRAAIVCRWMLAAFALTRLSLWFRPNADFNVGPYNVHHLFTGVLIMSAAGIAATAPGLGTRARDACAALFGIGLALTLDEWVYLIVTDGTNAAYWTMPSVAGGVTVVGLAAACLTAISFRRLSLPPSRPLSRP
jgi:hypothetical protein